jgi:hypothetical protein
LLGYSKREEKKALVDSIHSHLVVNLTD